MIENNVVGKTKGDWIFSSVQAITTLVRSSLLFIPFSWRETQFFTRQVKVQIGKKYFRDYDIETRMPNLAGKIYFSIQSFPPRARPFQLLIENRLQSTFSRTDILFTNTNSFP